MAVIELLERVVRRIWRFRFRIPASAFWTALLVGATSAFFVPVAALVWPVALATVGLAGVLHWRRQRTPPALLLVPRVATYGDEDRGRRVQDLVLNTLQRRLTADEMRLVRPLATVVGPNDTAFGHMLLRRLRSLYILYGRTEDRPDGGWSVLAGLAQEIDENILHIDWHTRDRTPAKRNRDLLRELLTPARAVEDIEDPLAFTSELQALVRGIGGRIAELLGDDERAERELRGAIAASGDSPAHPVDQLRVDLAQLLRRLGRGDDALSLLRARRARGNASPELLRALAAQLGPLPGEFDSASEFDDDAREEAIEVLTEALEHRADPRRTMTLYNLYALMSASPRFERTSQAEQILDELMTTDSFYRRAWYVHRHKGATHWHRARRLEAEGDVQAAMSEYAQAAHWYSSALRARPRIRINYLADGVRHWWLRFPPSPVLQANARDAHREAGHRVRATFHAWRTDRHRKRHLKRAFKLAARDEWERAYANFDFASVGEQDLSEAVARTFRAIALLQMNERSAAEADWAATRVEMPLARLIMAQVAANPDSFPRGLPGDEPADPERVARELRSAGYVD